MRIFGWAAAHLEEDGCSYYRVQVPFGALRAESFAEVDWRDRIFEPDVIEADVILGQRLADPVIKPYWQEWRARGKKLVADLDDDLFSVDPSSPAWTTYDRPEVRETLKWGLALADRVTVSTEPLADVVRQYCDDVVVVPNAVPSWLVEHQRPRRGHVVIGWAGSGTHAMDVAQYRTQWWRDVEVHAIGGDPAWWLASKPEGAMFRHTPWIQGVPQYLKAVDFDVCAIPLKDHVFNYSKSAIKAMEMAALGIPVVAQYCEAYRASVWHGVTGYLTHSPDEMAWRIHQLVQDEGLRAEMGDRARIYARRNFTVDSTWRRWENALTTTKER